MRFDEQDEKKISVIIPTLNRADSLKKTLESVNEQDFPKEWFEVIVIDNGSTDHTESICREYHNKAGNLRYIFDARPGLHIGRNRGFLESKSDILVYADDDIIAFPTWLSAIYRGFQDKETVLIGGNNYPLFEEKEPRWVRKLWYYDRKEKVKRLDSYSVIVIGNTKRQVKAGMIFGCNFAIRKAIVKQAGGFHPDGVPDQYLKYRGDGETYITEYITKHRLRAMFYPEASVRHIVSSNRLDISYIEKVAYRSGISNGFTKLRELRMIKNLYEVIGTTVKQLIIYKVKSRKKDIRNIKKFYYYKGYCYIILQFMINRTVKEWVLRKNYFNAVIPMFEHRKDR